MFSRVSTQKEWLTEDLAQIQRYFPGATLVEAIDTPFDLTRRRHGHKRKATDRLQNVDTHTIVRQKQLEGGKTVPQPQHSPSLRYDRCILTHSFGATL